MKETPFKKPLKESRESDRIQQVEGEEEILARAIPLKDLTKQFGSRNPDERRSPVEFVALAQRLFTQLKKEFHIPVLVNFFIAKDEKGEEVVFSTTPRIEGQKLDELTSEDIKEKEGLERELRNVVNGHIAYIRHIYMRGGPVLYDIFGLRQYMYGKKEGDSSPHIYLIDVDPFVEEGAYTVAILVGAIEETMGAIENKFSVDLSEERKNLDTLVAQLENEKER